MAGSGYGGEAGAAMDFYTRHRGVLLSLLLSVLGLATGAATAASWQQDSSLGAPALIVAGALLAGGVAAIHTRHLGLAFLAAAAPLPGLAWAAPISAGAPFGAVPLLAYIFGYGVAVMLAQGALLRALDGRAAENPLRSAAVAVGLMAALALLWFWGLQAGAAAFQGVADVVLASASAFLLVPVGASFLHFDEDFVASANRARERRQRVMEKIAMVAVPRWGVSIAGIALIFAGLAWFGAQPSFGALHIAPMSAAASLALVFLAAAALCGGWREGFAAAIVAALVGLMLLWAATEMGVAASRFFAGAPELIALGLFLVFAAARRALAYRRLGDESSIARLRAVEDLGGSQIFATLGAIAALLPSLVVHPGIAAYGVALVFAGLGALGFAPALVTAGETLWPRRRSVEELYGRR